MKDVQKREAERAGDHKNIGRQQSQERIAQPVSRVSVPGWFRVEYRIASERLGFQAKRGEIRQVSSFLSYR